MKTVELSAALGQAQVVENLKNFVGVDAQGAAALMTPERLAAVAGENMCFYSNDFMITNESESDILKIVRFIHEKIVTNGRNISFSVTVRAGIVFKVEGYLYSDKSHGLFCVYDFTTGLRKAVSLREGAFSEIN